MSKFLEFVEGDIDPVRALQIMIHERKAEPTDWELQAIMRDALQVKDYLGISVAVKVTNIILDDPDSVQRNKRANFPEFHEMARQYGPIMSGLHKKEAKES